mgnify:CR=1 FL=1
MISTVLSIIQDSAAQNTTTLQDIIKLLDVIVWPFTIIIVLFLFKKNLSNVIGRLGSFEASAQGISMTFQKKMEETANKLLPAGKSKSSITITSGTPNEQLNALRLNLEKQINDIAKRNNLETNNMRHIEIANKLVDAGGMTLQKSRAFSALHDLTNSGDSKVSQAQVDKVKLMIKELGF